MNVLLINGKAVGRLDADGSVWTTEDDSGYAVSAGRVDRDGSVFALSEEACLGSVDSAGLIWSAEGRIAGSLDLASNAVYREGHVVGHVFGPDPCRAAAALLFLVSDSVGKPGYASEEATQESHHVTQGPLPLAIAPPHRSRQGIYMAAHFALAAVIVGGMGWGGVALFATAARAMRKAHAEVISAHPSIQATPAQHAPTRDATMPAAPVRALLEERYRRMDAFYRTRNETTFTYFAPEWKYVNRDGSVDDLGEAKRYFALRSSGPKKFIDCSLEQQIHKLSVGADTAVAVVDQKVYTETRQKDGSLRRARTLVRQEDMWRDDGGEYGWRCVRSRLLSQKSTRL